MLKSFTSRARSCVLAALIVALPSLGEAALTRVAGPVDLWSESLGMWKFDVAFDTINRVYLVVWGTQLNGPAKGVFVTESGAMIGSPFAISGPSLQSGWARVVYSAETGKFLVSYTKLIEFKPDVHQKAARFVTYSSGAPALGTEIILDTWGPNAGSESGVAFANVGGGRFYVSWWRYSGQSPVSFVATLNTAGDVVGSYAVSNPADGQSDPEIACDAARNRCMLVGLAWGAFASGPSTWGRYIDATTGIPQGPDSFYIATWNTLLEDQSIVFSQSRFVLAYIRASTIVGHTVDRDSLAVGAPYVIRGTSAATGATDGGGYGGSSLIYNPGTQTTVAASLAWSGLPSVQELDVNGNPIDGSLDFVPNAGGAGAANYWDFRSKFAIAAANSLTGEFLVMDDHFYKIIRVSRYSTGGGGGTPPPPPPPPGPSISALNPSHVLPAQVGTSITWTATASGGSSPLLYRFERWRPGTGWQVVRLYDSAPTAVILAVTGNQAIRVSVKTTTSSADADAISNPVYFVPGVSRALSLDVFSGGDAFAYHSDTGVGVILSGDLGVLTEQTRGGWGAGRRVVTADFNGDGLADLFTYDGLTGDAQRAINIGNENFEWTSYSWATGLSIVAGDFNGDGRDDLFTYSKTAGTWTKHLTTTDVNWVFDSSRSGTWSLDWELYTGDFNGDGITDIFVYNKNPGSPNAGRWARVLNAANGSVAAYVYGVVFPIWNTGWTVQPGDFDGDGKTDIFLYHATGQWYKVFFPTTAGAERYVTRTWSTGWLPRVGDFNGDRKDDVFVYNQLTGAWFVCISTGDDWAYYQGPPGVRTWGTGFVPTVTDINRDGLADLIVYNPSDGRWFQIISSANPGQFGYYTGPNMETGLQMIASLSGR